MNDLPKRKNNRLVNYDYSRIGCYFITLCIRDGCYILWDEKLEGDDCERQILSEMGKAIDTEISFLSRTYANIKVDKYVIMPNHIHMLLFVIPNNDQSQDNISPPIAFSVSQVIKQFKGAVTKKIGFSIWQKSFYDHVIRDNNDYLEKWYYIDTNPARWNKDEYYKREIGRTKFAPTRKFR